MGLFNLAKTGHQWSVYKPGDLFLCHHDLVVKHKDEQPCSLRRCIVTMTTPWGIEGSSDMYYECLAK